MPNAAFPSLGSFSGGGVCLNMIVKDEQDVIARCLRSVRPHIDSWCIADTGSTDSTKNIIWEALRGIPGSLHSIPKGRFDVMRNQAWELALENQDPEYLMFIDADEELAVLNGHLPRSEHDAYLIYVHHCGLVSERYWMVRKDYPHRWFRRIHEDIQPFGAIGRISDTVIVSHLDGARAKDPDARNKADLRVLLEATAEEPEDPGYWYYLGMTYYLLKDNDKAFEAFLKFDSFKTDGLMARRAQQFLQFHSQGAQHERSNRT